MAARILSIPDARAAFEASLVAPQTIKRNATERKVKTVAHDLSQFQISQKEVFDIAEFYRRYWGGGAYIKKTKAMTTLSMVFFSKEDVQVENKNSNPGLYLLLKSTMKKSPLIYDAQQHFSLVYHWESECLFPMYSFLYSDLGAYEIFLNRELSPFPQIFATGLLFHYNSASSSKPSVRKECDKAGVILPQPNNGNLRELLTEIKEKEVVGFTTLNIVYYALHLAAGIYHMHEIGFVHLDLSMDNILQGYNGYPLISNFRLAETTLPSKNCGSPGTASPERIRCAITHQPTPVTFADDVWSFGCLLSLLSENFSWHDWWSAHHNVLPDENEITEKVNFEFSGEYFLNTLIRKCLAYDPAKRPTVSEIIGRLKQEEIHLTKVLESEIVSP